jgi:hypothetical protein
MIRIKGQESIDLIWADKRQRNQNKKRYAVNKIKGQVGQLATVFPNNETHFNLLEHKYKDQLLKKEDKQEFFKKLMQGSPPLGQ